jgi:hypothetical protein
VLMKLHPSLKCFNSWKACIVSCRSILAESLAKHRLIWHPSSLPDGSLPDVIPQHSLQVVTCAGYPEAPAMHDSAHHPTEPTSSNVFHVRIVPAAANVAPLCGNGPDASGGSLL